MINVIGLGYIGLPTALMLAAGGNEVVGTDLNRGLVADLNNGTASFEENGLEALFAAAADKGIRFSCDYQVCDTYIVAVPTPYTKENKQIDPGYVVNAIRTVLHKCVNGTIIIIESTISPNTVDRFIRPLVQTARSAGRQEIHIVHAPERIIPGNMIYELQNNSRTIGADSIEIAEKVSMIYKTFCKGEIVLTDIRTAEMSKVVENTYRDINIAFANELAQICAKGGMDVHEVIRIANMHPRVNILSPGPGVGGHCISVDPWFLVGDYPDDTRLVKTARNINDEMPSYVMERMLQIMRANHIHDIGRVGLYGLTYKENVNDIRESPTLQLLDYMHKYLLDEVKVYDPYIHTDIVSCQYHCLETFLADIDVVVIMVAHSEILNKESLLMDKIVFDTRNKLTLKNRYRI